MVSATLPRPPVRRLGLARKGALVMAGFGAALMVMVGVVLYPVQKAALIEEKGRDLRAIVVQQHSDIRSWIDRRQRHIYALSQGPRLRDAIETSLAEPGNDAARARVVALLAPWVAVARDYRSIQVIDAGSGAVLASTDPADVGKDRSYRTYFERGQTEAVVSQPFHSMALRHPVMFAAAPVHDDAGETIAVVAGMLDLKDLSELVVSADAGGGTLDVYMVNEAGFVLTPPRHAQEPGILRFGVRTEAVRRCLDGGTGMVEGTGYHGEPVLSAYGWMAERSACLIAEIQTPEIQAQFRAAALYLALVIGLGVIVAAAGGMWLASRLLGPIIALRHAAEALERGEVIRVGAHGTDEIGDLAHTFDRMAKTIADNRQALEERSERLAAYADDMKRLAYAASHDLRTPLRGVDSLAQWLEEDVGKVMGKEARTNLALLRGRVRRMEAMLDGIRSYQRADSLVVQVDEVDIDALVAAVAESIVPPDFTTEINSRVGIALTSETALREVLTALVDNAVRHHDGERGHLRLGARRIKEAALEIIVSDDGPGIAEAFRQRVFGLFQTLRPRDDVEGSGIGLALVRKVVDLVGGTVAITDNENGRGTTVRVVWPTVSRSTDGGSQ